MFRFDRELNNGTQIIIIRMHSGRVMEIELDHQNMWKRQKCQVFWPFFYVNNHLGKTINVVSMRKPVFVSQMFCLFITFYIFELAQQLTQVLRYATKHFELLGEQLFVVHPLYSRNHTESSKYTSLCCLVIVLFYIIFSTLYFHESYLLYYILQTTTIIQPTCITHIVKIPQSFFKQN